MNFPHAYTLQEIELLRSAVAATHRPRPRRGAPWRRRVRALLREHPRLTVFTVDADEIASQLAHDGCR